MPITNLLNAAFFLSATVALNLWPGTALANPSFPVSYRHVPFPDAQTLDGISLDLDGDGKDEYVGLATGSFYSRPVLILLAADPSSGVVQHLGGAPLPLSFSAGRLLSYRIPGTSRDALVALQGNIPSQGGRVFEGTALKLTNVLPRFDNQPVLAIADVGGLGVPSVFTSNATGITRWDIAGGAPLATVESSACVSATFPFCLLGHVAQLDDDAGLELVVAGESIAVMDATTLVPSWELAYGPAAALHVVNIDADAQREWLVQRDLSTVGVFEHASPTALREISCINCFGNGFAVGDGRGADGRDELIHGFDPAYSVDLGSGVSTSIGSAGLLPRTAVDFDGDNRSELVTHFFNSPLVRVRSGSQPQVRAQFLNQPSQPIRQFGPSHLLLPQAATDATAGQLGIYSMLSGDYAHFYPQVQNWQVLRSILDVQYAAANSDGVADIVLLTDLSVNALSGVDYSLLWRIEPQLTPARRYPMRFTRAQLDADPLDEYLVTLDRTIEAWDAPSGQVLWSINESSDAVAIMELQQLDGDSGLELIISGRDHLKVYDLDTRTLAFRRDFLSPGAALAVRDFGGVRRLYAGSSSGLVVLDATTGAEVHQFPGLPRLYGLVAVPDSELMVGLTETHAIVLHSKLARFRGSANYSMRRCTVSGRLESARPACRARIGSRLWERWCIRSWTSNWPCLRTTSNNGVPPRAHTRLPRAWTSLTKHGAAPAKP